MKITEEDAILFSLIKWEYRSNNDVNVMVCDLVKEYPWLGELKCSCGFCEYYDCDCSKCPLAIKTGLCCFFHSSLYANWHCNPSKKNARKIYNVIVEIAEEFYKKRLFKADRKRG